MPVSVKVAAQTIYLSDTASTKDSITLSSMAAAGARRQTGADKKKLVFKDNPDESRIVMNKNSGKDVMASLQKMREDRKLCDVIIQVEDGEIYAHRNVLMVHSPYFFAMFSESFHEHLVREIPMPAIGVDRQRIEALIDYMYSGQLTLTPNTVQDAIMISNLWQMMDVKNACMDYMERQIDVQNCLDVVDFARLYMCEKLEKKSLQVIKQRFPLVVDSVSFLHLSLERLEEILSFTDLTLGIEGEDVVLKAVLRWVDYCTPQREQHLPVLLGKVHLSRTSKAVRKQVLDNHNTVVGNEELRQLIAGMMAEVEPVEGRKAQTTLYVIGGFLQSRTGPTCPRLRNMERLDPFTNEWTSCADLPILSSSAVAFSVYGHLFCVACVPITVGRANITVTETKIFEYNFVRDEWRDAKENFATEALEYMDSCLQADGAIAVCPRTHSIYTISHSEVAHISVHLLDDEVYCRDVRLLPRPREYFTEQQRQFSAVVVDRGLYVLGGDRHDNGMEPVPTARVIMLDLDTLQWKSCADMLEPRVKLDAVELNGQIYACGGFNVRRLASMERYDPATDTWTALQPMEKFRSHHHLLVLNNKIWAMGGKSYSTYNGGARKVLNLCEVYDPDSNTWTEGQPMKSARCGFAAVAV